MPRRWLEGGPRGLAVHNTVAANYKNSYYKTTRLQDYMDYKATVWIFMTFNEFHRFSLIFIDFHRGPGAEVTCPVGG